MRHTVDYLETDAAKRLIHFIDIADHESYSTWCSIIPCCGNSDSTLHNIFSCSGLNFFVYINRMLTNLCRWKLGVPIIMEQNLKALALRLNAFTRYGGTQHNTHTHAQLNGDHNDYHSREIKYSYSGGHLRKRPVDAEWGKTDEILAIL